jgi:hypothetical protein
VCSAGFVMACKGYTQFGPQLRKEMLWGCLQACSCVAVLTHDCMCVHLQEEELCASGHMGLVVVESERE